MCWSGEFCQSSAAGFMKEFIIRRWAEVNPHVNLSCELHIHPQVSTEFWFHIKCPPTRCSVRFTTRGSCHFSESINSLEAITLQAQGCLRTYHGSFQTLLLGLACMWDYFYKELALFGCKTQMTMSMNKHHGTKSNDSAQIFIYYLFTAQIFITQFSSKELWV